MGVTTTLINKPFNPRGNDQSPKGYNRAALYSGKALDFDGVNDYVQADGVNETLDNYTLSWNLKTTSTQSYSSIFSNSTNVIDIYIKSNGQLRFYTDQGYDSTNLPPVNDGQWKNFVLSISGTSLNIYVNGVLSETLSITDVSRSIANIRLGYIFSNLYAFNGDMAGFKLFNTALTAEQVADLYNNPEKVVPTGVDNTALKLWLPMMEGAGTTAYDGSGNGNHGTISGATYVNGIGAPVAQSAVMDWNKGTNIFDNSENFDAWLKNAGNTITSNSIAAPDGLTTADTISSPVSSQINQHQVVSPVTSGADYVFSVWLKKKTTSEIQIYQYSTATPIGFVSRATINFDSGTITDVEGSGATIEEYTNGWFRCAIYCTAPSTSLSHGIYTAAAGVADVYAWGGQSEQSDTLGPYVRTGATAQNSEVLLPQGLTTGRDITGVNLFENVRKQGALNLDGNSWAEVHDNASLDLTTAVTLEAWVYWTGSNSSKGILGRWFSGLASYMFYASTSTQLLFFINTSNSPVNISGTGWKHIVGTYDSTNRRVYIDGQEIGSGTGYTSPIAVGDKPIEIGRYAGNTAYEYDGEIAQPRIYNRALTASEIQQNYNAGKNTYTN